MLAQLLPGRALAIRVARPAQPRAGARLRPRRAAARRGRRRSGSRSARRRSRRARLKSAVAASARLVARERWDSPFTGMATGFAIPLAAGGELYGVLDVGYPPGGTAAPATSPRSRRSRWASSIALRTIRLQEDAIGLRDYQARLLDSANALILGIDRSWRITVCNRALLELTGVQPRRSARPRRPRLHRRRSAPAAHVGILGGAHRPAPRGGHGDAADAQGPVRSVWAIAPVGRAGTARRPDRGGRRDRPGSVEDRCAPATDRARRTARDARRARRGCRPRAQQPADVDHGVRRVPRPQARVAGHREAPISRSSGASAPPRNASCGSRATSSNTRGRRERDRIGRSLVGRPPVGLDLRSPRRARRHRARRRGRSPSYR